MKLLISLSLLCTAIVPLLAQTELFDDTARPKSFKLSELNSEWRHISIGGNEASKNSSGYLSMLFGGQGSEEASAFFTKGMTVNFAGEKFLVVYKFKSKPDDISALTRSFTKPGEKAPDFSKLTADNKISADTVVILLYLSMKSITQISDVRQFDLQNELLQAEKLAKSSADQLTNQMKAVSDTQTAANVFAKPSPTSSDAVQAVEGASSVEIALRENPAFAKVNGDFKNGTVILNGTVKSEALKAKAYTIAVTTLKKAKFTCKLVNNIKVSK